MKNDETRESLETAKRRAEEETKRKAAAQAGEFAVLKETAMASAIEEERLRAMLEDAPETIVAKAFQPEPDDKGASEVKGAGPTDDLVADYRVDFTRLLYMHHLELDNSIRQADQKANLILGVDAILIAAITTETVQNFLVRGFPIESIVLIGVIGSVFFSLLAVLPRFTQNKNRVGTDHFFGDIVKISEQAFLARWMDMTLQQVKESVLSQIYAKSHIAQRKFINVRRSAILLLVALVVWGLLWLVTLTMPA